MPILVGHHRRHNPIIRRARAMIAEGALGQITTAAILSSFFKPPEYFELAWRRQPGGGPVLINLIHEIDLVRHLCGEIASVQAVTSNAVRGFEVEDTAAVVLRLVNGALVTITLCDTAVTPWSWDLGFRRNACPIRRNPHPVTAHFLCGTEGSLGLPGLEFWSYKGEKSWFAPISREQIAFERGDPYVEQLKNLCRVARGEEAAPCFRRRRNADAARHAGRSRGRPDRTNRRRDLGMKAMPRGVKTSKADRDGEGSHERAAGTHAQRARTALGPRTGHAAL